SYFWEANNDGHNEDDGNGNRYLQDSNQPVARFSVPSVQEDTTFEFTLTVIDDEGAEDKDKTEIKVEAQPLQLQQLSPIRQQQSLSEEQQNKQAQYEGKEEGDEDENDDTTDIWLPPPSSHIIRIPDIIDIFS
ncbi:MAG TPA: hypothetical protein VE572_00425, partial [Nitrososphaeraceae archaeon]|nr:hypothetical protein [Nitrososphaeraceae archaeon]